MIKNANALGGRDINEEGSPGSGKLWDSLEEKLLIGRLGWIEERHGFFFL